MPERNHPVISPALRMLSFFLVYCLRVWLSGKPLALLDRNPFILFRTAFVRSGHVPADVEPDHRNLSRIAGEVWRRMSPAEKKKWNDLANEVKEEHKKEYPNYRYDTHCAVGLCLREFATPQVPTRLPSTRAREETEDSPPCCRRRGGYRFYVRARRGSCDRATHSRGCTIRRTRIPVLVLGLYGSQKCEQQISGSQHQENQTGSLQTKGGGEHASSERPASENESPHRRSSRSATRIPLQGRGTSACRAQRRCVNTGGSIWAGTGAGVGIRGICRTGSATSSTSTGRAACFTPPRNPDAR
jgi:hypothetical protein